MKKTFLLLTGLAVALVALAQGTASPLTFINADMQRFERRKAPRDNQPADPIYYIPAIVRMDGDNTSLPDYATVLGRRGDLVLINVPADKLEEVLSAPGVMRMESGVCAIPAMDHARNLCNLPQMAAEFPAELTGEGVVIGFADTDFDPNHINFSDESGGSRVRRLYNFTRTSPLPVQAVTPAEISAWDTDDSENWHATHVAGILAGGYRANGFYGVAPKAEIVATTSPLYDAYLLAGAEKVVEYARSQDAPVPVFNMSISSGTGPHDGTTLFNQYLNRLADDAVICISAGNDGNRWGAAFPFEATSAKPKVRAIIREKVPDALERFSGIVDFWSMDERPLKLTVLTYDLLTNSVMKEISLDELYDGSTHDLTLITSDLEGAVPGRVCPQLDEAFSTCYVRLSWEINPENGRYNLVMAFDWQRRSPEQDVRLAFDLEAAPGVKAGVYASSAINFQRTNDDALRPAFTNTMNINDLACGDGIAVVGAMVSRDSGSESAGEVAQFTSFGSVGSRTLPNFCAPGAGVVSSKSTPYYNAHPDMPLPSWSNVEAGGRMNRWDLASGTSMSSPYAAGVFTLWLQACPSLTPAEILQAARTTLLPAPDNDPRWGGGILDCQAGLKAAMKLSGISEITTDAQVPVDFRRLSDTSIAVTAYTQLIRRLTVTDISGKILFTSEPLAPEYTVDLARFSNGIYIITASTGRASRTVKVRR